MIEIKNLSRTFGPIRAVDNISFKVDRAEIVGFLGPNGAGKTTTMRMMVGYLEPNSGSIMLDGKDIFADPLGTAAKIGYLPEHNPLYHEMGVVEFLAYIAALRRMDKDFYRDRLEYVIDKCGLEGVLNQKIGTLSKGYKQRVGLSQAILHDPEVLLLDEPTSGLDPNQIMEIRELIIELGSEKTVLLSSHIMQEVQAVCDRVIIINKGRIVVDDLKENLALHIDGSQRLILEVKAEQPDLADWLFLYPQTRLLEYSEINMVHKFVIQTSTNEDLRTALTSFAVEQGWAIQSIFTQNYSLEEIFRNLTLHDPASDATAEDAEPEDAEQPDADELIPEELETETEIEPDPEPETQKDEEVDQ